MRRSKLMLVPIILALFITACSKTGDVSGGGVSNSGGENTLGGSLTVSCFDTMVYKNFLEEAVSAFEEQNPGSRINIETFSAMPEVKTQQQDGKTLRVMTQGDDTQAKNDYINKVNTELMGGKGADVIAMDVLPFYRYAANGQLEDLVEYMDNDPEFNREDYRANVLDALNDGRSQYVLPIDYYFDYFGYDSSLIDGADQALLEAADAFTYERMIEIGARSFESVNDNPDKTINIFGLSDSMDRSPNMFTELLKANYSRFVDVDTKKVNFTDGTFARMLSSIKEYSDKGYIKNGTTADGPITSEKMEDMMNNARDERYLMKSKNSMSFISEFNRGMGRRMMTMGVGTGNDDDDMIAGLITNDEGEIPFTYRQAYAINSNSDNKQLAWKFIKFLCGERMQESLNLMGLPINTAAFMERAKMEITGELYEPGAPGRELDEEGQAVFDSYVAAVNNYTGQINTYFMRDATIDELINSEVKYFFDGTKSADEVAEVLQSKVTMYLNE